MDEPPVKSDGLKDTPDTVTRMSWSVALALRSCADALITTLVVEAGGDVVIANVAVI
jgi:hypothetical protein